MGELASLSVLASSFGVSFTFGHFLRLRLLASITRHGRGCCFRRILNGKVTTFFPRNGLVGLSLIFHPLIPELLLVSIKLFMTEWALGWIVLELAKSQAAQLSVRRYPDDTLYATFGLQGSPAAQKLLKRYPPFG